MSAVLHRLGRAVPDWPRLRYNTFTGTNRWPEWFAAWRELVRADFTDEEVIRTYEAEAARAAGCRHAFSFGAGRMALYALLEALDLEPGAEVVLPGYTCTVVPNALLYRGLRPVYADIEPVTFNVDPDLVAARIGPRTRALYLQHTFGVGADADRLRALAAERGLRLIEDASHSVGARHRGRPHGSLGDVAFFSTDRTKVVNTHLGGLVTTNDDALARRLADVQARASHLRPLIVRRILFSFLAEFLLYHPRVLWFGRPAMAALRRLGALFYWRDELLTRRPDSYPFPCRLSSSQARLGSSQLARLPDNLGHRRAIARWLEDRVGWYRGTAGEDVEAHAWLRYSFLVRDQQAFIRRLADRVELMVWFTHVMFCRERDLHEVGYQEGSCPVAEKVARHIVNFPTHPRIPLSLIEDLWSRHGVWIQSQILRPEEFRSS